MGARIDVGVDAEGDWRAPPEAVRNSDHALELRLGFQVDAADAPGERELDLGFGFADAGEKCLGGGATGGEDSSELAARYDVESRAELGQKREDGEVRIRFDGIADPRVAAGKRLGEFRVRCGDRTLRVHVARRAEAPRDVVKRRLFGAQHAVTVVEGHRGYFFSSVADGG